MRLWSFWKLNWQEFSWYYLVVFNEHWRLFVLHVIPPSVMIDNVRDQMRCSNEWLSMGWMEMGHHAVNFEMMTLANDWWWWHPTSAGRFWSLSPWRKSLWIPRSKFHRQFLFVWKNTSLKYMFGENKYKEIKEKESLIDLCASSGFGNPQGNDLLMRINLIFDTLWVWIGKNRYYWVILLKNMIFRQKISQYFCQSPDVWCTQW